MGEILNFFTAKKAADAQKDVSRDQIKASTDATDKTIALQKEMFDKLWGGTQVQRDAGDAATKMMAQLMGLSLPASQPAVQPKPGQPQVLPAQTSPVLNGKTSGNALAIRAGEFPGPTVVNETGGTYGGVQSGNYGGQPGTVGAPGNALNPTGPIAPTQTPTATNAAPFDATAWLRSTPGYEMNFKEGQRALSTGLASAGRLTSGDAGREMTRYGQGYADRTYGDQYNRLASIAGAGQTAQSQGQAAGTNYANNSSNALQNNAANLGSSYQNRGNAISGFWGNVSGSVNNAASGFAKMYGMGGF